MEGWVFGFIARLFEKDKDPCLTSAEIAFAVSHTESMATDRLKHVDSCSDCTGRLLLARRDMSNFGAILVR